MKHRKRAKLAENRHEGSRGNGPPASGHSASSSARSTRASSARTIILAAGLIVLAAMAAYSNSLQCSFVFDDRGDIVDNTSIRHLWPVWNAFFVQSGGRSALHGRPVVNLSLAFNYAIGGLEPFSYHLTNLAIHLLAGLILFGIVRRTLVLPRLRPRFAAASTPLALAIALIWTLHPLQTGAVTYIVQRYESMMGLFYFAALYAALRCGTSEHPRGWAVAAVAASLLAMGCKEVAVSVPLMVLLYDRSFLAGSFREAWRRRWRMYVGLAAAWAVFAVLFLFSFSRAKWAGYDLPITWMEYGRSQFGVMLHYLRLSFWPHPLVLDYRWPVAHTAGEILPGLVVMGGLAAATVYGLIRWPEWGFLGAWFFLILAPTSSIMPLADLAFEHRMYLPLAAVATGVVVGGYLAGRWLVGRGRIARRTARVVGGALVMLASVAFGMLTFDRNRDYRSELSIWEDTVAKAPGSARAENNLGFALVKYGRLDEAIAHYHKSLELNPDYADAHSNLGVALNDRGQVDEAMAHYRKALEIKPDHVAAHYNAGIALVRKGQLDEAISHYQKALNLQPDNAAVRNNLGNALGQRGDFDQAIAQFNMTLQIKPDCAEAHYNLGLAFAARGQLDEAISHYQKALAIKPGYAEPYNRLGTILAGRGKIDEAMNCFRKALEIKPDDAETHYDLGLALAGRGRIAEAIEHYHQALKVKPDYEEALNNLAWLHATCPEASFRDGARAMELAQRAIALSGGRDPNQFDTLAAAYAEAGRFSEAVQTARQALDLATEQNKQSLAASLKAKIPLYEAGTPFRAMPQAPVAGSIRP